MKNESIVVGVDQSRQSMAALQWAAHEAALRRRPLRLVHGFVWPSFAVGYALPPEAWYDPRPRREAERLMAELVAQARDIAVGVPVSGLVVDSSPAAVLIGESRDAAAVVVGSRGAGGFAGLLPGSVTIQVATHAQGPVVVIPPNHDPHANERLRVVVGVDGSDPGDLAAGFAFDMAAQRGVELTVVRAWTPPQPAWRIDVRPLTLDVDEIATAEMGLLRTSLSRWESMYPQVRVEPRLVADHPANALVAASDGAQLLVVGSRGLGGIRGRLLGSVSLRVLHQAHCAVAVVHPHHSEGTSDRAQRPAVTNSA